MNLTQIHNIYDELRDVNDFNITVTTKDPIGGRKIIAVTEGDDDDEVYFYRSSGTSREKANTINIWFPCLGNCISPRGNSLTKKRISKLEDEYITKNNTNITHILETNPDIKTYMRFITKKNAMISKKLFNMFSSGGNRRSNRRTRKK